MNQPLVSIILPVYNAQNHLARCVGEHLRPDLPEHPDHHPERRLQGSEPFPSAREFRQGIPASCWWTRPIPAYRTPATSASSFCFRQIR